MTRGGRVKINRAHLINHDELGGVYFLDIASSILKYSKKLIHPILPVHVCP